MKLYVHMMTDPANNYVVLEERDRWLEESVEFLISEPKCIDESELFQLEGFTVQTPRNRPAL